MMRMAGVALLLAGCAPVAPVAPVAAGGECGADGAAVLVGKAFSARVEADARRRSGARMVRVIRPDTAVTMDYRTDRLNIDVDAGGVVRGVRCG